MKTDQRWKQSGNISALHQRRGQEILAIGCILLATGMISAAFVKREQVEKRIASGFLTLVAGAAIALVGFMLTTAGSVAVVGGSSVATKSAVADVLRW